MFLRAKTWLAAAVLAGGLVTVPAYAQDAPQVQLGAQTFTPAELHVPAGTTVSWNNGSGVEHTVTADDSSWDSGITEPGDVFTMEFDTPGRYQYYCQFHGAPGLQDMAGVVIVE
jgi:plastocyanin